MQFEEFLSVVDLIKNADKYSAKVAELQAREDAINESIKQLGEVKNLAKAKAAVALLQEQAQATVANANKEAMEILASAQTAYNDRHERLKSREVVADQALANYNTIKNQQAARENELRVKEKEVEALRSSLKAQEDTLRKAQAEVDERLAKLRQVMG